MFYRFLSGNENYTLVINMDSKQQHIKLSDQMKNLSCCLNVVFGSGNSNYYSGYALTLFGLPLINFGTAIKKKKEQCSETLNSNF